jgi:hypothetical protein
MKDERDGKNYWPTNNGHSRMEVSMNSAERRMQYLDLYRQQLRRETEAMGYGQKTSYQTKSESRESTRPASWQLIPAILAILGLFNKQIQPSR